MSHSIKPNKWFTTLVIVCLLAAFATSLASLFAIQKVLSHRDSILMDDLTEIAALQKLMASTERRVAAYRGYFLSGEKASLESYREAEAAFPFLIKEIMPAVDTEVEKRMLSDLLDTEQRHRIAVEKGIDLKQRGAPLPELIHYFDDKIGPLRKEFTLTLAGLEKYANEELEKSKVVTKHSTDRSIWTISITTGLGLLLIFGILYKLNCDVNRQTQALAKANRELEEFASIASHDLKSPLYNIAIFLQLLQSKYKDKLDSEAHEFINFAVQGAQRMTALIERLLAYAQRPNLAPELVPTNLNLVIEEAMANLKAIIQEANVTLDYNTLPTLAVDRIQMVELFQNLISNGIKYHKPQESPKIEINAHRQKSEWQISVKDNGIGFDAEQAKHIFEPFKRLEQSSSTPGTGLGLAVCKRIIDRHVGRIWAESSPGTGSTFYFTLPA